MPETTGNPGQFAKGQSGNPAGRPKGARHKLGEAFITAMANDFNQNGTEVIRRVRVEDPSTYVKVIAGLLPKEVTGEDGGAVRADVTIRFIKPDAT